MTVNRASFVRSSLRDQPETSVASAGGSEPEKGREQSGVVCTRIARKDPRYIRMALR